MNTKKVINDFFDKRKKYFDEINKIDNPKERLKKRMPNILTASRLFAPLFIIPATLIGGFNIGLILAILFALTDAFDGFLARKWNAFSEFGKVLDPICDKMFAVGVAVPILITDPTLIIPTIILEGVIASISCNAAIKDNNPHSTYLGKFKTVLLSLTLAGIYFCKGKNIDLSVISNLLGMTNIFQVATASQYQYLNIKEEKKKQNKTIMEVENPVVYSEEPPKKKSLEQEIREYKNVREALTTPDSTEPEMVKIIEKM